MITLKEFTERVLAKAEKRPEYIRKGQAIFNYIDDKYGEVAREVQFLDHIDCFYNDDNIYAFIRSAYDKIYNR